MKAIDKVRQLRKSTHLLSPVPQRAYENRIRRPRQILRIVEGQKPSASILNEARRQYVVCLACAFEIFWRETVRRSIDDSGIDQTRLKGLGAVKMSMREIAEILHHGMTLGELVSSSISFQGVAHVGRAVSTLLDIDAFKEYRSYEFIMCVQVPEAEGGETRHAVCFGPEALKRSNFIDQCFEIRHDSVHNTGTRFRVKPDLISRMESAMDLFNLTFGMFTERRLKDLAANT